MKKTAAKSPKTQSTKNSRANNANAGKADAHNARAKPPDMQNLNAAAPKVKCPQCKTEIPYDPSSSFRPFCSERCKLIDLGAWADTSYRIPTSEVPSEEELLDALKKQEE